MASEAAESAAAPPAEGSPPRPLGALSPSFSPSSPASPVPPRQGWPEAAGLSELVSVPEFAALLVELGADSLALFGENIDLGEGHDKQLRAVLQALPSKPKRAKAKRNRCIRELEDLLTLLSAFDAADKDEDGLLNRQEVASIAPDKVVARSGEPLSSVFGSLETAKPNFLSFSEFFCASIIAAGEDEPPESPGSPTEAVPEATAESAEPAAASPRIVDVEVDRGTAGFAATPTLEVKSVEPEGRCDAAGVTVGMFVVAFQGKPLDSATTWSVLKQMVK